MQILWRSDRDEITFKAIERHRYGLRETVSKTRNQKGILEGGEAEKGIASYNIIIV